MLGEKLLAIGMGLEGVRLILEAGLVDPAVARDAAIDARDRLIVRVAIVLLDDRLLDARHLQHLDRAEVEHDHAVDLLLELEEMRHAFSLYDFTMLQSVPLEPVQEASPKHLKALELQRPLRRSFAP
jgi:hypothetical protein